MVGLGGVGGFGGVGGVGGSGGLFFLRFASNFNRCNSIKLINICSDF